VNRSEIIIKKAVAGFRDKAGLTQSEPINTHSLLLKLNILTLFRPLSEFFSGMAIKTGREKFILINSNHSLGRQNFTIGHELYHLFIQDNFETHICNTGAFNKKATAEYHADLFSANLLMPETGILEIIPPEEVGINKVSFGTILKAEQLFRVSHQAMLFRLRDFGLINTDFIESGISDVTSTAKRLGFDTSLYLPANYGFMISDYGILANNLYEKGKISEAHFAELMDAFSYEEK
jgi:Zn-dependent peptidase ImmA (M78 family)